MNGDSHAGIFSKDFDEGKVGFPIGIFYDMEEVSDGLMTINTKKKGHLLHEW